jgi:hypothetical protein
VVLNVILSAAVAFAVINLNGTDPEVRERLVTFELIITTTPDPNAQGQIVIVTATPGPNETSVANLPPDLTSGAQGASGIPTLDPTQLGVNPNLAQAATALPQNCIPHVLADGENPAIVADIYGADVFDLLAVNGIDEDSARFLQIGDVLIVPLEGCELLETGEVISALGTDDEAETEEPDTDATEEPEGTAPATVQPTITLAPTATNAQVEIVDVIAAGDITLEAVEIRNSGNTINMSGWTLSDGQGNTYVFPDERRLFSNASVTINTRAGQNTPIVLYWGRDTAIFEAGDVVVLADSDGVVQASLRIPEVQGLQ